MAKRDLIVEIKAKDGLTPALKDAQKALKDTGAASSVLGDMEAKFAKITSAGMPAKRQLREMQTIMANLNLNGLDNTQLFTRVAEEAGRLKDAIGDAQTAVSAFANDNFKLQAMAQSMQLVASAGSIATGVMGMFGSENEKVTQAILKVQSSLSILNGVQSVANLLNKDSALMLRLKQIRMLASTATTTADTAATGANTIAGGTNTAAVTANNVARQAWNTTVAIGKALMGDWTGLLLVGAAALTTYAIATSGSKDKLEEQGKAAEEAAEKNRKFHEKLAESTGTAVGKFMELKSKWETLKTTAEKTRWIEDNRSAFAALGLSVSDLATAEDMFVNRTDSVVQALEARARAAALQDMRIQNWKDYYERRQQIDNTVAGGGYHTTVSRYGGPMTWTSTQRPELLDGMKEGVDYTVQTLQNGLKEWTVYERARNKIVANINARSEREAKARKAANEKAAREELDKKNEYTNRLMDEADADFRNSGAADLFVKTPTTPRGTGGPTSKGNGAAQFAAGSLAEMEAQLKEVNDTLRNTVPDDRTLASLIEQRTTLEDNIRLRKEELGLAEKKKVAEQGSIKALEDRNAELRKALTESGTLDENTIDDYRQEIALNERKIEQLKIERGLQSAANATSTIGGADLGAGIARGSLEDKRLSRQSAASQVSQIQEDVAFGFYGVDEALLKIEEINKKLEELGLDRIVIHVEEDGTLTNAEQHLDLMNKGFEKTSSVIGHAGQAMQGLGKAVGSLADENEGLQKGALIAQAIGELTLGFASSMKGGVSSPWEWIAAAIAGVGTLTALVATLSGFQDGGIVGGSSFTGDRTLVKVNSGEMILNKRQQSRLWEALDGNRELGGGAGGEVIFTIDGDKLSGVLNNYNSKKRRRG